MKPKHYILALIITVVSLLLIQHEVSTNEKLSRMQEKITLIDAQVSSLNQLSLMQYDSIYREEFETLKRNVSEFVNVIFQQREQINQMREDKQQWDEIVGDYFNVMQRRYEAINYQK